jgi:hypothetical protein
LDEYFILFLQSLRISCHLLSPNTLWFVLLRSPGNPISPKHCALEKYHIKTFFRSPPQCSYHFHVISVYLLPWGWNRFLRNCSNDLEEY